MWTARPAGPTRQRQVRPGRRLRRHHGPVRSSLWRLEDPRRHRGGDQGSACSPGQRGQGPCPGYQPDPQPDHHRTSPHPRTPAEPDDGQADCPPGATRPVSTSSTWPSRSVSCCAVWPCAGSSSPSRSPTPELGLLVATAASQLLAMPGVGTETAGQLLVTVGDNPERLVSRRPSRTCAPPPRSRRARGAPTGTASTAAATPSQPSPAHHRRRPHAPRSAHPRVRRTPQGPRAQQQGHHPMPQALRRL